MPWLLLSPGHHQPWYWLCHWGVLVLLEIRCQQAVIFQWWGNIQNASTPLPWHHNGCDGVSNHQPHHCLLNCLFRRRSNKTSKLRVTGLCAGNSPRTGEFPAQMASNVENSSIWWRHHDKFMFPNIIQNVKFNSRYNTVQYHMALQTAPQHTLRKS